ncbi:MAG: transposase [Selenomonadaceae bacterium]|nr:transposase [Selenomonadaceae bacterium]
MTTDTIGCLLSVVVHKANLHDTKIGIWAAAIAFLLYPTIEKFCGDGGYRKTFVDEVKKYLELEVEISEKITPHGWQVISPRWIVERTLAWLNHSRRLSKNYEYTMSSAEAMVKISHIHTLLKRL